MPGSSDDSYGSVTFFSEAIRRKKCLTLNITVNNLLRHNRCQLKFLYGQVLGMAFVPSAFGCSGEPKDLGLAVSQV
jgi:hypothetical protein